MRLIAKRALLLLCGLAIVLTLVGLVALLGSVSTPDQTQAELQEALQSGKPVLVAFYSTNCKYCEADEPVLAQLEEDLDGMLIVVRVSIQTEFGKQLAQEVGVRGVPTYFLIDTISQETLYTQSGPLQVNLLLEALP